MITTWMLVAVKTLSLPQLCKFQKITLWMLASLFRSQIGLLGLCWLYVSVWRCLCGYGLTSSNAVSICVSEKVQWVQCEDCFKLRKLPAGALVSSKWTCSDNSWDPQRYAKHVFYFCIQI